MSTQLVVEKQPMSLHITHNNIGKGLDHEDVRKIRVAIIQKTSHDAGLEMQPLDLNLNQSEDSMLEKSEDNIMEWIRSGIANTHLEAVLRRTTK